jgi:ABC-type antimicrobial peptide transport system, ATPase component
MLQVKGMDISYRRQGLVIEQGNFEVSHGQLCLLQAESGAGKSSILSLLALNQVGTYDTYMIDNQDMRLLSDKEKSDFLLYRMAYVAQEAPLLDHMNVEDQLEWASRIGGSSGKEITAIMEKLKLLRIKDKKIKKLSGGEKQRVCFANAILKNAEVYLFDEPTAMQDEKNKQMIAHMIQELVEAGKIVIVATHEVEWFDSDIVYTIKDKKLICLTKRSTESKLVKERNNQVKHKQLLRFLSLRYLLNYPFFNGLFIFVSALCFSLAAVILKLGMTNVEKQYADTYELFQNELFVVNQLEDKASQIDSIGNLPLSIETVEKLQRIENVSSVEPFKYLLSGAIGYVDVKTLDSNLYMIPNEIHEVEVLKNKEVIRKVNLGTYYHLGEDSGEYYYPIAPSYSHQKIDKRCEDVVGEEGLYISKQLADYLGIEALDGQSIRIKMGVAIAQGEGILIDEDGKQYDSRTPFYVLESFEFKIVGILSENIFGNYGVWNQADMYLPIEKIEEICQETRKNNRHVIKAYEDVLIDEVNGLRMCVDIPWQASAYVINIKDYEAVNDVVMAIKDIDPYLDVSATFLSSGRSDQDANEVIKNTVMIYSAILCLTLFAGSVMMNYFNLKTKERDMAYLSQNGFSKSDYQQIFYRELMYKLLIATMVVIILIYVLLYYFNRFWIVPLKLSIFMCLLILSVYWCVMYASGMLGQYFYFKKISR